MDRPFAQTGKPQEASEARKFRNQGIEHYRAGRFKEAVEAFERAIELKPDYAQAHNDLGMAYVGAGRYTEAITQFLQAIQQNPLLAEAYYNLGTA
ncbi:MAG TPA: tetratricopeptide repeat protein, partial [Pyrinomonadaceae bacterium]